MSSEALIEARALNDQAVRLMQEGNSAAAHSLLRRAAQLYVTAGAQRDPNYVAVLRNLAAVARLLGNNDQLRDAYLQVADAERLRWPETDPQRADALNAVAASLYQAGEDATAEALVAESLDLRRRLLGEDSPEVATSLTNLGHLRMRAGDLAGARRLMERAATIRAAALPEADPDLADSWSSIGELALTEGDGQEAERMFARALGILAAQFGADDPRVADVYEYLARARFMQDDRAGALLALREAVEIHKRNGAVGEDEARALNNLADAYYGAGAWDDARELYAQAATLLEDVRGPDDTSVGDLLNNLANAERERGASREASYLYERVLHIQRRYGDDNPRVHRVRADIAELREREAEPAPGQLLERAMKQQLDGDYSAAERLARRAVEVRREAVGRDDEAVMEALLILGNILSERADREGARAAYTRALTAARTEPDADYATVGAVFAGVGNLEIQLGNPSAAEAWHRKSLALLDAHGGPSNQPYPKALRNLAIALAEQGNLLEAAELLERALKLLERQGDERTLGETLTSLGRLRLSLGDTNGADVALGRALTLLRHAGDRRHPDVADALMALADADVVRGEPATAEARLREALEIFEGTLGESHPRTLAARRRLAVALQSIGDRRDAETLLLAVLSDQREQLGDSHPEVGVTLVTLGNLYASGDRKPDALPLLTEAAEVLRSALGREHASVVAALASVGSLYANIGASDAAEHFLKEALDAAHGGRTDHSDTVAQITAVLARLKRADGDLAGAGDLLAQALDDAEHRSADLLTELASVRAAQGATLAALDLLERAFVQREDIFAGVLTAAPERTRLAFLGSQQHMLALLLSIVAADPTQEAVDRAFDVVLRHKALASETAVSQRYEIMSGRHPELIERLRELARLRERQARALLTGASAGEATTLRERTEALERSLASRVPEITLTRRVRAASRASIVAAMPAHSATIEIVQHIVDDLTPRGGRTVGQLFERRAGYVPMRYLAFVLASDPARPVQLVNLGDVARIDELVAWFRMWITGDPDELARLPADRRSSLAQASEMLRAAVVEPLEDALGDARQLFVAPDGDLTRLPFEALPDGHGGYLIDRLAISYLSAARDIVRFGAAHERHQSAPVVVADPDFDLRAVGDPPVAALGSQGDDDVRFGRLTGTREEGKAVADLLGAQRLFGYRAVESAVKAAHAPKVLHLATHGWFLADRAIGAQPRSAGGPLVADVAHVTTIPGFGTYLMDVAFAPKQPPAVSPRLRRLGAGQDNPLLRSGLALAGANAWLDGLPLPAEAEDGLLTAEDVATLDLFGTDLVVLSACETGLGEVVRGEGVFGLRRAFVLAGAATLVMSLWKVPDDVTAELMPDFYRRLQAGAGPAEALRCAQLAIRAHPDLAEPFYWAAFICQGDLDLAPPSNRE